MVGSAGITAELNTEKQMADIDKTTRITLGLTCLTAREPGSDAEADRLGAGPSGLPDPTVIWARKG
jgi:hypothetical protein